MQREIDRAAVAVDDVAAAGRGRRLPDHLEPVDIQELLAVQAATWRPVARTLGTDLRLRRGGGDLTVRADRGRLVQATANLIANAIEHGGGRVTIAALTRGDRVEIEVADEGSPDVPQVIRPQRPGASRRGLAIVADIAARHGRLVARTSGRGTRMAVELPRRQGRVSRRRRAALLLGLALLFGGLAASDVSRRERAIARELGPQMPVMVSAGDLKAGALLGAGDLAVRRVPSATSRPAPMRPPRICGRRVAVAVLPGTDLVPALLAGEEDASAPRCGPGSGRRTSWRSAPPRSCGPAAGWTWRSPPRAPTAGPAARCWLRDAEVLSARPVSQATSGDSAGTARVAVSLRVTLAQALALAEAQSFARELRVLPRAAAATLP